MEYVLLDNLIYFYLVLTSFEAYDIINKEVIKLTKKLKIKAKFDLTGDFELVFDDPENQLTKRENLLAFIGYVLTRSVSVDTQVDTDSLQNHQYFKNIKVTVDDLYFPDLTPMEHTLIIGGVEIV